MIVRIWRGQAEAGEKAEAYHRHVTGKVFPALKGIPGHEGAYLLQREAAGRVEFLAMTLWGTLADIRAFAGEDAEAAVVEPAARAVLAEYDDFARHYELTYGECK